MPCSESPPLLPAPIAEAIGGIPQALVPASVRALDRLIGAAVDVPIALLAQQKAKIDAQTEAYRLVENSIAKAVATEVGVDQATIGRAVEVLVRKSYRKQVNREAVAHAMLNDLRSEANGESPDSPSEKTVEVDEDWLNIFERYAEDASTERMQVLWGRVLSGEIRSPGRFSTRTLRFLSEFSQADALTFERFCTSSFGDTAPKKLVQPSELKDIRSLIYLEANGLIQGVHTGLTRTLRFNQNGRVLIREGKFVIVLRGVPETVIEDQVIALTPLGQELVSLLPARDALSAARAVAAAMRVPEMEEAYLGVVRPDKTINTLEVLWIKDVVEGAEEATV